MTVARRELTRMAGRDIDAVADESSSALRSCTPLGVGVAAWLLILGTACLLFPTSSAVAATAIAATVKQHVTSGSPHETTQGVDGRVPSGLAGAIVPVPPIGEFAPQTAEIGSPVQTASLLGSGASALTVTAGSPVSAPPGPRTGPQQSQALPEDRDTTRSTDSRRRVPVARPRASELLVRPSAPRASLLHDIDTPSPESRHEQDVRLPRPGHRGTEDDIGGHPVPSSSGAIATAVSGGVAAGVIAGVTSIEVGSAWLTLLTAVARPRDGPVEEPEHRPG